MVFISLPFWKVSQDCRCSLEPFFDAVWRTRQYLWHVKTALLTLFGNQQKSLILNTRLFGMNCKHCLCRILV